MASALAGQPGTATLPAEVRRFCDSSQPGWTRQEHRDAKGELVDGFGVAVLIRRRDQRSRQVAAVYRNAAGEPTAGPEGASDITYVWDEYGTAIQSERWVAPDGRELKHVSYEYDSAGRRVAERAKPPTRQ